ncbi:MAG: hypothetical protein MJ204_02630 [Bacteroidales bacterium]|nr:hypothetical protein [Bacteroidales bacterium]MCQ2605423.1 hypothetical protein [Bacteroidales bacterium]
MGTRKRELNLFDFDYSKPKRKAVKKTTAKKSTSKKMSVYTPSGAGYILRKSKKASERSIAADSLNQYRWRGIIVVRKRKK